MSTDKTGDGKTRTTVYTTDNLGRVTRIVTNDPDGSGSQTAPQTEYHYDALGNRVETVKYVSATQTSTVTKEYDARNRVWRTTTTEVDGQQGESLTIYDRDGLVHQKETSLGDGKYSIVTYDYDQLRRLTTVIEGGSDTSSLTTYFLHDAAGNERYTVVGGAIVEHQYDARNREILTITPAAEGQHGSPVTQTIYYESGDVQAVVDALNRRTDYARDNLGQLVSLLLPEVTLTGETIDPQQATQGDDPPATTTVRPTYTFQRDLLGNVVLETDPNGHQILHAYNNLGMEVSRTVGYGTADAQTTTFGHTAFGETSSMTDACGQVTRYDYDALGQLVRTVLPHPDGAGQEPEEHTAANPTDCNWSTSSQSGYGGSHRHVEADGTTANTATWTFSGLDPEKQYQVLITWPADENNAASVSFNLLDGSTVLVDAVEVDQTTLRGDATLDGYAWQTLGVVTASSGTLNVVLDATNALGHVVADAGESWGQSAVRR